MRRWIALAALVCLLLTGCGQSQEKSGLGNGWEPEGMMPLDYAHEFSVAYYPEDCKLITPWTMPMNFPWRTIRKTAS